MKHILTIDDEAAIRHILEQLLGSQGYRVTAVASAEAAMRVVRSDPPDLVVTDLQLEDSDGFAIIEDVKAIAPNIPVILLTGVLFDPASIQRFGADKIAGYVEKTAPLTEILALIKRCVGG